MLNKKELIKAVSDESGLSENDARAAIDGLIQVADREVKAGGGVSLPGFGKLFSREAPKREVRNPKTGKWLAKDSGLSLRFQPSAKLRRGLNG